MISYLNVSIKKISGIALMTVFFLYSQQAHACLETGLLWWVEGTVDLSRNNATHDLAGNRLYTEKHGKCISQTYLEWIAPMNWYDTDAKMDAAVCDEDHDGWIFTRAYKNCKICSGPHVDHTYTCHFKPTAITCPSGFHLDADVNDCVADDIAVTENEWKLDSIDTQAATINLATNGMSNAGNNYSENVGMDPNAHQAAATEGGGIKVTSASKDKGAPISSRGNANTASGKKSANGSGAGGSGGGFMSTLGNLFGSSDLKPETDAGAGLTDPKNLAYSDSENGSAYGTGSNGGAGGKKSGTDSYAAVLAGEGKSIEFGRDPASSSVNPMGSDDPANYFARIGLDDSLFKIVSKRYNEKTTDWARLDLSKDRLPASKKAIDAAKDPSELLKTSIK